MNKPLITFFTKHEDNLSIQLSNGKTVTIPYSKEVETKLLNLVEYHSNTKKNIAFLYKCNKMENYKNYGRLAVVDAGLIASFFNESLPGAIFFLLVVGSIVYVVNKCDDNDIKFAMTADKIYGDYNSVEQNIINEINTQRNVKHKVRKK